MELDARAERDRERQRVDLVPDSASVRLELPRGVDAKERLGDVRHRGVRVEVVREGIVHRDCIAVDGPGHLLDVAAPARRNGLRGASPGRGAGVRRSGRLATATPAATGGQQPREAQSSNCRPASLDDIAPREHPALQARLRLRLMIALLVRHRHSPLLEVSYPAEWRASIPCTALSEQ